MKKEEILAKLIDETFAKIACPLQGNGLYAEIKKAIQDAYIMGRTQPETIIENISYTPLAATGS